MAAHEDLKPAFKNLIQTAQQSAKHPRRSEDDYFHLLQRTMAVSPWTKYQDENVRSVPDQGIATASEFAHKLALAKNFQEFAQIETAFIRTLLSSKDFVQMATEATSDPIK